MERTSLSLAASVRREITWFRNNPFGEGEFTFSTTTGLGLSDFLLGDVSSLRQARA